ncbi:hypothetical protein PPS11_02558 [Pseudomonas putida S11]|nr:hypothetical protein PPS11_02558 [Pseudomonas putida S11]
MANTGSWADVQRNGQIPHGIDGGREASRFQFADRLLTKKARNLLLRQALLRSERLEHGGERVA